MPDRSSDSLSLQALGRRGVQDHCREIFREHGDAAKLFRLGEEALNQIEVSAEEFAEAKLPFPVGLDLRNAAIFLNCSRRSAGAIRREIRRPGGAPTH